MDTRSSAKYYLFGGLPRDNDHTNGVGLLDVDFTLTSML
jgi:hypothetical protein